MYIFVQKIHVDVFNPIKPTTLNNSQKIPNFKIKMFFKIFDKITKKSLIQVLLMIEEIG